MFGLMQFSKESPKELPRQHQRLHYCGVCKAMGRLYGQRTRMALNYDAIYLSELLTFLGEGRLNYQQEWSPALLSYNCLRLPKSEDLPISLQYAAAVNVLFSGIKLRDNVQDKGGFIWRTADKLMASKVREAENQLQSWGLDLEAINTWLLEHAHRESQAPKQKGHAYLEYIAEATAEITGRIFRTGAELVDRHDQADQMEALGRDFGKIVYLLDAYRDYRKDQKKGSFNPIPLAFGEGEARAMSETTEKSVQSLILSLGQSFLFQQQSLPLDQGQLKIFRDRIEENLEKQLGLTREEVQSCTAKPASSSRRKISFKTRWQFLRNLALVWDAPSIKARNPGWRTTLALGTAGLMVLLVPTLLHSRADLFTHIDPDFLSRFGDLHPDWDISPQKAGGCNECCQTCDGGCDNCCDECERTCTCIGLTIAGIALLLIVLIVVVIVYIVRDSNKKSPPQPMGQPGFSPHAPPQNVVFSKVLNLPERSSESILASAHDWFKKQYPDALPLLDIQEEFKTLYVSEQFHITTQSKDKKIDLGKVQYAIQIHIKEETAAIRMEHFTHVGGDEVPGGGPLGSPVPKAQHPYLNPTGWRFIQQQVEKKANQLLTAFEKDF